MLCFSGMVPIYYVGSELLRDSDFKVRSQCNVTLCNRFGTLDMENSAYGGAHFDGVMAQTLLAAGSVSRVSEALKLITHIVSYPS